jgi:hypothetical protein
MTKSTLFVLLGLLLAGCQTTSTPVIENFVTPSIPKPQPIVLQDVQWKVYTRDDLKKLIDNQGTNGQQFVIFAVTGDGYKAISMNVAELNRYIREQRQVIVFLKQTLDSRSQTDKAQ